MSRKMYYTPCIISLWLAVLLNLKAKVGLYFTVVFQGAPLTVYIATENSPFDTVKRRPLSKPVRYKIRS